MKCEGSAPLLVLDPPDGLNLGSLGVGAKLAVALVLSPAAVTLHDVLVAAVSRVLVAHEAAGINENVSVGGKQDKNDVRSRFFSIMNE